MANRKAKMPKNITDMMKSVLPLACGHVPDCVSGVKKGGQLQLIWMCNKCKCGKWYFPEAKEGVEIDEVIKELDKCVAWIEDPLKSKLLKIFNEG